ncbi:MAG: asparagine synthase (glutamine-hydrolyzing) [Chloroflexi bacterium]|nr:MAG: asparagine synthase (glutamine-hydrolyzing) [Chloroflexota bacterium]MBL1193146.1 asparagine synthase (glutamine-hydrolyzing) [Chloroflexota bacterium]NOH10439.1 asparagine synthase (glutamine-hydrolyzing) [Chloroflexota bacterium]
MCGIVGCVYGADPRERRVSLERMCDSIAHRGPDDDGYFSDAHAGLGMRRLSIIDLESGQQPVTANHDALQMVFNGEIYNYQTLREDLRARGYTFKTKSDTEVVLRQYQADDLAFVDALNGMFALAIWDQTSRRITLARDRMGIKPLYYYWDGVRLAFASEIKALLTLDFVPREINPEALWEYFTFRYVPQPHTMWKNIYKLPPGHLLTFSMDDKEPQLSQYWEMEYQEGQQAMSEAEYIAEFEELFLDAVRLRLIADVPVGVLLSGGLDSSTVAAAIAEVHNASLNSFSVAFENTPDIDERPYAYQMAKAAGTDHHEIVIGQKEFIDFLPRFVHYTDEPIADLASVPLYYVSALARKKVKVVLSGEGSDEVLGGYHFDRVVQLWDQFDKLQIIPQSARKLMAGAAAPFLPRRWRDKLDWVRYSQPQWLEKEPINMTDYMTSAEKLSMIKALPQFHDSMQSLSSKVRASNSSMPLHQALYIYCQDWLVEDLLMKADRMSMANSLELRVPFLDHRLVEWTTRTPPWVKVHKQNGKGYETKWVLRRFAETRLPKEIIERPKQGFPVPVYGWLSGELKQWAGDLLEAPQSKVYEWLHPEEVKTLLQKGTRVSSSMRDKQNLWNLLILELWAREWLS